MTKLLVIPVQSVSDVITNSSSEVFILETDKTCEEVNTVLEGFTSGFQYPEVFSLSEFREWKKNVDDGSMTLSWSYPGTIFDIVRGWFYDSGDEESVLHYRSQFLLDPYQVVGYGDFVGHSYSPDYVEPIHLAFLQSINDNWDKFGEAINAELVDNEEEPVDHLTWRTLRRNHYWIENAIENFTYDFLRSYDGPKPPVWDIPESEDAVNLDGKILVVSNDDNSIPYDTWDKIKELFNGWNVHLG